jgi:16S rRNA (cytosine967-C5)-methyltransferase
MRVLDYCAGGGGKALAMAARAQLSLFVHDVSEARMRDIPLRAARAGTRLEIVAPGKAKGGHDLVLVDAPCSGSGAWRRSPEAKWRLTSERLEDLRALQSEVLSRASGLTTPNGMLAYVTCSLFEVENGVTIKNFLNQTPGWKEIHRRRLTPLDGGDGFFLSILKRE